MVFWDSIHSQFAENGQIDESNKARGILLQYGFEERLIDAICSSATKRNDEINIEYAFMVLGILGDKGFRFYSETLPIIGEIETKYPKKSKAAVILKNRLEKEKCEKLMIDIAVEYLLDGQPMTTLADELEEASKTVTQKENIVALQSLVNELAKDHAYLVKLDVPFCDDIVKHRPLVALLMLMNDTLRPLMERRQDELDAYIDNFDIYKQLLPYIKIQDGTTHGQWRHLVDPKKKCFVLTAKNCQIAASEQLKRTYGESDSKFLVLQGLSMKANDDNAEVHYLEV